MSVVPQFLATLHRLEHLGPTGPSSLLTRAAVAAAATLPGVEGVTICVTRPAGMRVAVAVSDTHSLLAEQLEYTAGDGPGLLAQRAGHPVVAGASLIRRYPALHDGLRTHTGFRGIRAVLLPDQTGHSNDDLDNPNAVLLLYYGSIAPVDRTTRSALLDTMHLAVLIGHAVIISTPDLRQLLQVPHPPLTPPHIVKRLAVETAANLLCAPHGLLQADAVAVLRGHAFAAGRLVDDTAHDIVTRRLTLDTFR